MQEMTNEQRASYISGIIEGLAYARFQADGKQEEGMSCIYDWYYRSGDGAMRLILQTFDRYGDYPPGAVLWVLTKRQCGE